DFHVTGVQTCALPIYWGVTTFAREQGRDVQRIGHEIDAFNAAAREIALRHGAAFVDITPASREAGDADGQLVADGLHPSAAQYEIGRASCTESGEAAR